ncbi:hypothetical protein C8J57DRAFT_1717798 [Mycena rebaudengoi]|nr:hypothetical protein C8J57DRAFT_1717798 [Mycena rebaudengoi]
MFSLLNARLLSRLGAAAGPYTTSVASRVVSRAVLASTTRRTFLTSSRLLLPTAKTPASKAAAKPATKAAPKKAVAKKAAPKTAAAKKPAAKKAALKKKVAPKKKKVVPKKKKVVVKKRKVAAKPLRITKSICPPPRTMTAYIMFSQEYMAARPVSPGDKYITKDRQVAVATAWKALSEAEKEPYRVKSQEERARRQIAYEKFMAEVDPKLLYKINAHRRAKKLPVFKNPLAPKRPLSAYMRFAQDHRVTIPAGPAMETGAAIGAAWRALPQSEKDIYIKAYQADREVFLLQNPKAKRSRPSTTV